MGKGHGNGSLPYAGNVVNQNVAAGQNGSQYPAEHLILAQHRLSRFRKDRINGFFCIHRDTSILVHN